MKRGDDLSFYHHLQLNQLFFDTRLHVPVYGLRGPHQQCSELNHRSIKDMNSLILLFHHSRMKQSFALIGMMTIN